MRISDWSSDVSSSDLFAAVILVQSDMAALAGARIRPDRGGIVEIEQHGRMPGRRQQHVAEAAEGMGADRLALIGAGHGSDELLAPGHGEMVGPELHTALDAGGDRKRAV